MRVLGIDPGAKRAGWAVVDNGPSYVDSHVIEFPRPKIESYQEYRLKLVNVWVTEAHELIEIWNPDLIVTEIVPAYGMNDFGQGYLANVMATAVQATAYYKGFPPSQVSAVAVQNAIGIKGKSKKVTKAQVRNGVISLLPELAHRKPDWVKVWEEPDALAIALFALGYKNN